MPVFETLRLTWEQRILSILRVMVGVLYMEHGLAKILDFPHQPNHSPYALFTLVPGLQGLLELVGGLLLALGLFTAPSPSSSRAI
jgi:putative oxidoreductase